MAARGLDTLIFFVTSRCNAKCRTCFYFEELNRDSDLSFEEIERMSDTMPSFAELWLSGGEPTLREDLVPILERFHRRNGVRSVNLPVNGLRPERLVEVVSGTLARCPGMRLNVNLALDGIAETHDRIRGVPGNYERALESLARLQSLRREARDLRVHVNSVVCRDNVHEMLALGALVRDRFDLDGHYFQIIRGEPLDPALTAVHREDIETLYRGLRPLYRHYADKLGTGPGSRRRKGPLGRAAYLGVLGLYHEIQAANLDRHHRWPMPCTAARTIAVVDANGDLRSCELRERLANLRDYDLDWARFWASEARRAEVRAIARDGCWCTHVCFIHASLKASPRAMAVDVPRAFWHQTELRKDDHGRGSAHRA